MDNLYAKMTASDASVFMQVSLQSIHKHLKTKDIESFKSQNRVYFGFESARKLFSIPFEKKVISFQIVKGGTGKTSIAYSFAIRANLYGARVLCIDLDQQGNLTHAFSVDPNIVPVMIDVVKNNAELSDGIVNISPGLDLFPSRIDNAILDNEIMLGRFPLEQLYLKIIEPIRENYDLIIFDCPPALGHSVASSTLASDIIISPVTPEQFGLSGLKITYDEVKILNKNYLKDIKMKVLLNKFDSRTALSSEVLRTLINDESFKDITCNALVRSNQEFSNTIFAGTNIYSSLKNTSAKEDIDLLVREVLNLDELYNKKTNKIELM